MKKHELATLAMLGISAALLTTGCDKKDTRPHPPETTSVAEQRRMSPDMQRFYSQLSPDAQQKFLQMDLKHRQMSMEMLNQQGEGQNACQGLGGCQTKSNSCAGQNQCKSQGGPAINNPNKAVETQYSNQFQQRGQTTERMSQKNNTANGT